LVEDVARALVIVREMMARALLEDADAALYRAKAAAGIALCVPKSRPNGGSSP
jgi:hypothetical protein